MMRQLADVKQVRDKLAHHFSGIILVIVGKRQALVLIKKFLAHIAFHARSHHMALVGDIVPAQVADDIHHKKAQAEPGKAFQNQFGVLGKQMVGQQV